MDLVSRTGTRFDDASFGSRSSWVRAGRGLEVAGFRIEVIEAETSGDPHAPALGVDPLAEQTGLCPVELGLGDETVQPLSLLSELTFLGRSRACAIRVEGEDVARVHALIVRSSDKAFLVNLAGPGLTINGEPATLSAPLRDGDRLGIGQARLLVHLRDIRRNGTGSQEVAAMPTSWASPSAIHASDPIRPATPNALRVAPGGQKELTLTNDQFRHSLITAVRQLCQEQSALFERHLARLDRLQHEVAELRAELRERLGSPSLPPAGGVPTALSSPPLPTPEVPLPDPGRATSWLIDRLGELEAQVDHESRSGWRDLLSRIGSPLRARDDS